MAKGDYIIGSSNVEGFFEWINERHAIYIRRAGGESKPWTNFHIFQTYKFTNAFRQLDKGTIALQDMLEGHENPRNILWNIIWYRMFNLYTHATELGFIRHYSTLYKFIELKAKRKEQIFTSAHMTTSAGRTGPKWIYYMESAKIIWGKLKSILLKIEEHRTMEDTFLILRTLPTVGAFVSYEMVCDLRFTPILQDAPDKLSWANVGPGAKRGMNRLGFKPTTESMVKLYGMARENLADHVLPHLSGNEYPPFELREIEHSLCEFDKYERVRLGQGRPRQRYNGTGE